MSPTAPHNSTGRFLGTFAVILLGIFLSSSYWQTCLSSRVLSSNFISQPTWLALATPGQLNSPQIDSIELPFWLTLVPCVIAIVGSWIFGSVLLVIRRKAVPLEAFIHWGWYGGLWSIALDVWEWLWIVANAAGSTTLASLLAVTPQFWLAACLSGWLTTWSVISAPQDSPKTIVAPPRIGVRWLWLACGAYFVVFTMMNWRLYFNLLVPHGDSVMYEEHLWNLLHGKGFRSYLDQGLFWGEHIQFVHLFLIPLYAIWPSHLLLEACSSAALACGALPVFWMARRHSNSDRLAFAAAVAYLLYFPMQFLDIEIDLKTFRPESFGIPLLLLALDQLDRKQVVGTIIAIVFCLTVKEDYSLILGPLGLWIALSSAKTNDQTQVQPGKWTLNSRESRVLFGLGLSLFSVAYLWLATRVLMPWFRSGAEVHYASYFAKFGKSPEEIVRTMLTQPGMLFESLFTAETTLYAIALLAPLAFLPLLSPGRLAVGLPLFGILCLNELEGSRTPQHQFHAPLVAILFWALAAALPRARHLIEGLAKRIAPKANAESVASSLLPTWIWSSALTTGIFFGLGPLSTTFWDPGSNWSWQRLYGPTPRAAMFARIADLIPTTARVASTDFVHPRYTHFERSYDYSDYQRKVSGAGKRMPDDTDYLVIDTQHRYSRIKHPNEIPELNEHPDLWEVIPDVTEGYFIVLKRKPKDAE